MSYRVEAKSTASQAWVSRGVYGSESSAMLAAERFAKQFQFVRVVDDDGHIVWSG
jgi:hypothetical protein